MGIDQKRSEMFQSWKAGGPVMGTARVHSLISLSPRWSDGAWGIICLTGVAAGAVIAAIVIPGVLILAGALIYHSSRDTPAAMEAGGGLVKFALFEYLSVVDVIAMNIFDFLLFFVILIIPAVLAVHYLAWPILSRALYTVQRTGLFGRKKTLGFLGITLVGYGFLPESTHITPAWETVKTIIESFWK
jgi:quinol-cytochrome oxidoreductase complex cytochrome b subunit